ncbi:pyruvate dehydrogenase subunit beta [Sphaerisporangium krabiense]|uniref:Pyruvate dehydrogenase E1 component beta subunit n=1 Tax=Sphaerisporangium krabiense TaxID=763782 RepID=A0A7W9DQ68_9ACTN|nr:alpha-ketoacid dehydrogenase subunit beta [Sphaerisporangium krabiense]MBB5626095.1 pyruvate dehydrogenase E1 component beta subunit [Sphaerisporangium krabiense]GII64899.1 pyruvate dehydrogenase subunit beta [Sphaerisporangium krabiense]
MSRKIYYIQAMQEGLRAAMAEDDSVVVIGEDVDRSIIGATRGLVGEFGEDRVRNTPISEATFVGACVGAAAVGLRPVVDLMVGSFFYVAMDQVANQAAKLRYMSGGQVDLPIVYFTATGPSGSGAAQHSENPHPMLMNVAGLKIVMPSTPYDAKGLMLSAVREPNPVVYFQDFVLGGTKGEVPEEPYAIPLGVADVKRAGTDVTVVAIGATVPKALKVAAALEKEGVSAEVVDPRTLAPLDTDTILESVGKTGRLVVCDSARLTCSAASEIVATVTENAYGVLKSAPQRVAWEDVPVPFSPVLEKRVLVDEDRIRAAVMKTLA